MGDRTMNYTIDDLEKDIGDIITELTALRKAKGHDYSGDADTLDNLREFGSYGIVVRLMDKVKRLKHVMFWHFVNWFDPLEDNWRDSLKCKDESIEDTIKDTINYALYLLILYRREKNERTP